MCRDLVSAALEFSVIQIAAGLALVRYAYHGDLFESKKFLRQFIDACHAFSPNSQKSKGNPYSAPLYKNHPSPV
jgi:hypothetical protein